MAKKKKPTLRRPPDVNEEAFRFVRGMIGEAVEDAPGDRDVAREMGRKGGKKGGKARAAALSPEERRNIAKRAAKARWSEP